MGLMANRAPANAGAAELQDDGAHAAASLVRPEQDWDEGGL